MDTQTDNENNSPTEIVVNLNDVIATRNTSGLANMGATCYINTAIQCLGYCPNFFKYILSGVRKHSTPLTDELKEILFELWINGNALGPHKFLKSLQGSVGNYLNIFEQNDASEFIMLYLDKLNTDMAVELAVDDEDFEHIKKNNLNNYSNPQFADLVSTMDIAWINSIKKEFSPLLDLFHGQLISQVVCGNCGYVNHNYETYCGLSLPLKKEDDTLNGVMDKYFEDEILNEKEHEWKCDKCNLSQPSKKTTKLWRNPDVLMVTLKRFGYDLTKNNAQIIVPDTIDLSSYCLYTQKKSYKLVSVCVHHGSFGGGHYVAVCRHQNGKWYTIDDLNVSEANDGEVEHALKHGYVYFFVHV